MSIVAALVFATLYIMSGTSFYWMLAALHANNPSRSVVGSQFLIVALWPIWWLFVAYGYYRGSQKGK